VTEHIEPWAARMSAGGVIVGAVREQEECVVSFGDVSEDHVFELGSVTKPFTGTLLAEMVDRGEVRLDDTVASFLPTDVAPPRDAEGGQITLASLATHSAALPRAAPDWGPADPHNPYADFTVDKLYDALGRTVLDAPIGTSVTYSNYGYALLGHALACAAARPYEELVVERVCRPLGLNETAVEPSADMRARRAQGHGMSGNPMPHWDRPVQNPAGGMEATIADAIRWLRAQLDPARTPLADPIAETQRPRIASVPGAWVGLGWFLIRLADESFIVWHSGRTGGFTSSVVFHPPSRTGVVALANSTSQRLDQETRAIAAALMKSE
jgi:CubicO group peptidase (beta-lactamase class C family)